MNVYRTHTQLTKSNSMLHLTIKKKIQRLKWKVNTRPRLIKIVRQNVSIGENNTCLCGMCTPYFHLLKIPRLRYFAQDHNK